MFTKKQLMAIKHIAAKGTKAESRTMHCTTLACGGDKLAATNNYDVVLFNEAERTGYAPEQCGETMTVGELVKLVESLSGYDDDVPVYLSHDNGYTYGSIMPHHFSTRD